MILKEIGLCVVVSPQFASKTVAVPAGAALYFCGSCEGVSVQGADMTGRIDATKPVTVRISQPAMVTIQKGIFFWRAGNAARFEVYPAVPHLPEIGGTVAVLSGEIIRGKNRITQGSVIQGWNESYFVPSGTILMNLN